MDCFEFRPHLSLLIFSQDSILLMTNINLQHATIIIL